MSETRTYSFSGNQRCLDELERLFKFMAACGDMGTSIEFNVFYDGDGSAHLTINRIDSPKEFNTLENEEEVDNYLESLENDPNDEGGPIEFSFE